MEDRMEQRYLPEKPILPLHGGMVYMGKDLSLNRSVILYAIDCPDQAFAQAYKEMLGEASQFTDRSFMHILDVGFNSSSNRLIAVLKPCNGKLLHEVIAGDTLALQEQLTIVYKLALGMQKALEEGIAGFSISADNVWIDPEQQPVVMNYWEQGAVAQRGTRGLGTLLLQMIAAVPKGAGPVAIDDPRVQESLRTVPAEQRTALVSLLQRVATEDVPLKLFIAELARLVVVRSIQQSARAEETEAARKPVSTIMKAGAGEPAAPRKKAEPAPPPKYVKPEDEEEDEEEDEPRRFTLSGMMKKLLLIGAAIAIIGVCSVLILMGLFEVLRPDKGYVPGASTSETSPPVADSKPAPSPSSTPKPATDKSKESPATKPGGNKPVPGATPTPSPTASPTTPPKEGPTQVPNLVGMTREEAEKSARAAGLRYDFFLEPNEMEQGKVFKQDPKPNEKVESGTKVMFWVSKGQ